MTKPHHAIAEILQSIHASGDQFVHLQPASASSPESDAGSEQPASLVQRALAEPLDFPPLTHAIVPGDRVAIAVGVDVPSTADVVRGVVETFEAAGIDTDAISIVGPDEATIQLCRTGFASRQDTLPQFVVHDAEDKDNLCLVGLTKKSKEPVVVNRTIFDADVVLPIGCARASGGAFEALFPALSSAEAIARFRTPANVTPAGEFTKRTKESHEAGWMIGVLMAMQVVPGRDASVAHIIAGEPDAVARRSAELYQQLWSRRSPRQVDLVIANISGGDETQNWQNVGRALANADVVLEDGGAVVICSNLEDQPGRSFGRLVDSDDLERTERKIFHDHSADSVPAWYVVRALQRGPVYLLSRLDDETVEDLGLAPVSSVDDLARLVARHESFVVIEDSQHAVISLD